MTANTERRLQGTVSSGGVMKTGRLLKFDRPGGQVHAYFYLDAGRHRAALYVTSSGQRAHNSPVHSITGDSGAAVEAAARAWVDRHFPRKPGD